MSIFRPSELKIFLDQLGTKAKKSLSQNFLIDGNIIKKILKAADVKKGDWIIEIGPGPGALTEALLNAGAHVIAIEKDHTFAMALARFQTEDKRLEIWEVDFLQLSLESLLKERQQKKLKVVSNLPYHLTTPIISRLVILNEWIFSLTLMVQKEVADRFCAEKKTSEYSSFTIFLQFFCSLKYCFTIEPTCFLPSPSVRSAVVHFSLKQPAPFPRLSEFFQMTRRAFQQRRKMMRSSLRELYISEKIEQALKQIDLNPQARPEQLSLEEFKKLFLLLSSDIQSSPTL